MKKLIILTIALVFLLVSCSDTSKETFVSKLENHDLNSEYIYWHGRTEYINEQRYFYNTATGFKINFNGSLLVINIQLTNNSEPIYFTTINNGVEEELFINKQENIITVKFDTEYNNTFELIKRSEPVDGLTSIKSVEVNKNFIKVKESNSDHFLLIGASGISGNGALGKEGEAKSTKNSSSLHSFGYLTAKHFKGTFEFVSASGFGLSHGFNDPTGKINIQEAYKKVGINYNKQLIATDNIINKQANHIIINVGGNDYSSYINNLYGSAKAKAIDEYKESVRNFISTLRLDHPNANIYWTMTKNSNNGLAAIDAVKEMSEIDQSFVNFVTIKQIGEDNTPVGGNNHASYETHLLSTQILIDLINSKKV